MSETANTIRHKVLVRVCDQAMNERIGLLIDDVVFRRVTFKVNRGGMDPGEEVLDGLVLIGPDQGGNGVEDIRRHVGECLVKILSTDEVWWLPMNAHRDAATGWWSVECVPLVPYTRVSARTDEQILEASGISQPAPTEGATGWLCPCGEPNKGTWNTCHDCGTARPTP